VTGFTLNSFSSTGKVSRAIKSKVLPLRSADKLGCANPYLILTYV